MPSPQDMNLAPVQATASTRFHAITPNEIDKTFLKTASSAVSHAQEQQKQAAKDAAKENLRFIKVQADNAAEAENIRASAELAQAKGMNAIQAKDKIQEKLEARFEKLKQGIQPQFHPYVQQILDKKMNRFHKFAIPHVLGEINKVKDEDLNTHAANAMNEALESVGDHEHFATHGLAQVANAFALKAERQYGSHPDSKALVQEAIVKGWSETIRRGVQMQAGMGDPDKAGELLTRLKGEMTPADRLKAVQLLDKTKKDLGTKEALSLADLARQEHPDDLVLQDLYLQKHAKNDQLYRASIGIVKTQAHTEKLQKDRQKESTLAQLNKNLEDGKPLDQNLYMSLPYEDRTKWTKMVNANQGGAPRLTNWKAVTELKSRMINSIDGKSIPDDLLDAYRHDVSPADMKPLESMFDRLKQSENREYARVHRLNYKLVEDVSKKWMQDNRIPTDKRGGMWLKVYDEVERVLTANPKISSRELQQTTLRTLRERGMTKKKVDSISNLWGIGGWIEPKKEVTKISDSLAPNYNVPVDPSWRNAIKSNMPHWNESQVNSYIKHLIDKGEDVSKPR